MKSNAAPAHWLRDVELARFSTWRIGGPARFFTAPEDEAQLRGDLEAARRMGLPALALGGGSNLLFADEGYAGLIVRLPARLGGGARTASDRRAAHPRIELPSGVNLTATARRLACLGLRGLEWAEGIPGTLGGAIVNNAGAYGSSLADSLDHVTVVLPGGSVEVWTPERLALGYRSSALKGRDPTEAFLLTATLRLTRDDPAKLLQMMRRIHGRREERLPKQPSCGCVFRNPEAMPAGRLIDRLGLGGLRVGGASVSTQHANFIVNDGGARAADVLELIRRVRNEVERHTGQRLHLEVQLVGCGADLGSASRASAR